MLAFVGLHWPFWPLWPWMIFLSKKWPLLIKIKHNWHVSNNQMSKPIAKQVSPTWITVIPWSNSLFAQESSINDFRKIKKKNTHIFWRQRIMIKTTSVLKFLPSTNQRLQLETLWFLPWFVSFGVDMIFKSKGCKGYMVNFETDCIAVILSQR